MGDSEREQEKTLQIIPQPKELKQISQLYLVQVEVKGKKGVVIAWDREDAQLKQKEFSSFVNPKRITVLGPFRVS